MRTLYMDWNNSALREWLTKDLAAAQSATWRFVAFHQPGFNSAREHFPEQYMRLLSPVFEAGHVDIVFSGHVHNYQRSFPFTFIPAPQPDGAAVGPRGEVAGEWKLDKTFRDGANAGPHGVILHRERRRWGGPLQSRTADRSGELARLY